MNALIKMHTMMLLSDKTNNTVHGQIIIVVNIICIQSRLEKFLKHSKNRIKQNNNL
jgi:hypothetical protein